MLLILKIPMKVWLSCSTGLIALIQFILGIIILCNNTQHCYYIWTYILINTIFTDVYIIYTFGMFCCSENYTIVVNVSDHDKLHINRIFVIISFMAISGLVLYLYLPNDCRSQYMSTYTDMWTYFIINTWIYITSMVLMMFIFICVQIQVCCAGRRQILSRNLNIQEPLIENQV